MPRLNLNETQHTIKHGHRELSYGVKECWLVDPKERRLEVVDLRKPAAGRRTFSGTMPVRFHLLQDFGIPAAKFFE